MPNLFSTERWKKLKFLTKPGNSLSQRVIFAGIWMVILRVSARGLGMIRVIIIARILTPEAFGLVSVALLTIELVNQVTATGFNTALVQKKGSIEGYLDTVWSMLSIRGFILGAIVVSIATPISRFFEVPDAVPLIQVMGLVLVIRGFSNSGIIYFLKELEVHKRFLWEMSIAIAEMAVAIPLALILGNAWSIVLGAIAGAAVGVTASFFIHPYRPHFKLDLKKAKELFNFGMWVLFSAIAMYGFTRLDSIMVVKLLGTTTLGIYTMAYVISRPVADEMSNLAMVVVFPTYSKLQDKLSSLQKSFSLGIELTSFVTFPLATAMFFLAPDFIKIVLGSQWVDAIPALRILGFAVAVYSLLSMGGSLLYATGKPHLRFVVMGIGILVIVPALFILIEKSELSGAAYSILLGNCCGLLGLIWILKKKLGIALKSLGASVIPAFIISLSLAITLAITRYLIDEVGIVEFISLILVTAITYMGASILLWKTKKVGPLQFLSYLKKGVA